MARLKWLIIPVFVFLLMSHNAGAISPVYDLSDYERQYYGTFSQDCVFDDTSLNTTNVWGCYLMRADKNLRVVRTNRTFDLKDGDIVTFDIVVVSQTSLPLVIDLQGFNTEYPRMSLIDMNIINGDYYYSGVSESVVPSGYTIRKVFRYTYRVNQDTNWSVGVGQANQNNFKFSFADGSTSVSGFYLQFYLRDVTIWRSTGSKENQEQEQKTQEQSEAGDSAADSSIDDVSNATQSLASAMGSIVSVIKDTPASDCNISISTTGSSAGFTSAIGALNLCSGVPSNILNTIRGLAALVIVPYVLYAAYSICIKMYRTFTEVQNT